MPTRFEFANGKPTLVDTLKILRTQGILNGEVRALGKVGESAQLSNLKLLKKSAFREFGFGLFLAWFYDHKFQEKYPGGGSYHLIGVDDDTTLFLCHHRHTLAIDAFTNQPYIPQEDLVPRRIRTGDGACDNCPLKSALKYNYSALRLEETPDTWDPDNFQSDANSGCHECRQRLHAWLRERILSDDGASVLLGGDGCLLKASPRLYEFSLQPGGATTDGLLDSFLVVELGLRHNFFGGMSGAELREPVSSTEMDGFLFDQDAARLMCFETTRSHEIESKHLRQKMATAALGAKISPNTSFAYLTLSIDDDIQGGDRGSLALAELLGDQDLFEIIGMPRELEILKTKAQRFDEQRFRKLFDRYLEELDQLVPSGDS